MMNNFAIFYLFALACFQVTVVEVSGGWSRWWDCLFGCKPEPDKTPPKFTYCPDNIHVNQDRNRRGADVTWVSPKAKDDREGKVRILLNNPDRGKGFFFAGEKVTVRYTAFDDADNRDNCIFTVYVEAVECSRLSVSNGFLNCGNNGLIYGTTCTLTCFPGFVPEGRTETTCQENEEWSPTLGFCTRVTCDALQKPINGTLSCESGKCTFGCNPGYSIHRGGSDRVFCNMEGEWSGRTPVCEDTSKPRITCPEDVRTNVEKGKDYIVYDWADPVVTDNNQATWEKLSDITPGETQLVRGSYQVHYKATDPAGNYATCSFNIFVSDIQCDFMDLFPDYSQSVKCSNRNKLGSMCTYSCRNGFILDGGSNTVDTLECLPPDNSANSISRGEWSVTRPTCSRIPCERLNVPMNGSLASSCGFYHGDFCRIECDDGFEVRGTSSRRCVNGTWDGDPASCEARTCPPPYIPYQSHILNPKTCLVIGTAAVHTVCEYGCNAGHFLAGNASLQCDENGRWFPRIPPSCRVITCDGNKVPPPANGYRNGCYNREVMVGETCTLGCNYGFTGRPANTLRVTCIEDENSPGGQGIWDHNKTLTCEPVECIPFSSPRNGRISECRKGNTSVDVNSTQSYGSACTSECYDGYTPYGTASRTCTINGNWDGIPLTCKDDTPPKVQCPPPKFQIAKPLNNYVTMDFEWTPIKVFDGSLPWTSSLKKINSNPVNSSNIPRVFTEGEYLMVYSVADRIGNEAFCTFDYRVKVLRCPAFFAPQYGELELVKGDGTCVNAVRGSVCRLTCVEGYHLSNDEDEQEFTCVVEDSDVSRGYWNGTSLTCESNVCNVPAVKNGYISGCLTPQVGYQTVCQFACNIGFQSPDDGVTFVKRTCQADGSWSGQDLNCTAVTCPGGFPLEDGDVTPSICTTGEDVPYGTVCRFYCKGGYQQNGPFSKRCGRDGHWEGDTRNTTCIDKEAPRFTTKCPLYVETIAVEDNIIVKYDDINATDNAGNDQVTITRFPVDSPENGGIFGEGYHIVSYTAQDEEGNFAKCNVYISVVVLRCFVLPGIKSGSKSCTGRTKGSTCEFTCNEGFEISGQSNLTCSGKASTATWDHEPPSCIPVECPVLRHDPKAIRSGCSSTYYGDECLLACPYGYQSIGSPRSECLANKTWSEDNFSCEEKSCPSIDFGSHLIVTPSNCGQNPTFEDTCHVQCSKKGYSVFPKTHSDIRCRGDGRWTNDISDIKCKDEEPPRIICPLHFFAYPERGEVLTIVSWNISVEDNSDENITVSCSRESGIMYPEGRYDVLCTARDADGNLGSCTFEFYVRVRSCRNLALPTYGKFDGQCDSHHGSICEIKCEDGYEIRGSRTITCEQENNRMTWKTESFPSCVAKRCPPIPADIIPADVGITPSLCQDKKPPMFGLECRFFCKKYGFRPVGYLDPITCGNDGNWNVDIRTISILCEDFIPPDVSDCPTNMFLTLSEGHTELEVNFMEPTATDNSGKEPACVRSPPDVTSPFRIARSTAVTYSFKDDFSNTRSCTFHIHVENDVPPTVVSCPTDFVIVATGRDTAVAWDNPVFSDPLGDNTAIRQSCNYNSGQTLPWGSHNIVCTAVNTNNNRVARCVFVAEVRPPDCQPLPAPRNGALACDEWAYGHFCNQQCNEKYDVPPGNYQPYFICGTKGLWSPPRVLDCSILRRTDKFHLSSSIQYYTGNCNDPDTQEAIKQAFIQMLGDHDQLSAICSGNSECTAEHVSVRCGRTRSSRGKRRIRRTQNPREFWVDDLNLKDFLMKQKAEDFMKTNERKSRISKLRQDRKNERNLRVLERNHRHTRSLSVDDFFITVSFDVVAKFNVTENATDYEYEDGVYDALYSLYDVADAIEEEALAGNFVPEVPDLDILINENASFVFEDPEPTCDKGHGVVWASYSCSPCVAGTYFDEEYGDCLSCPIGEYQDAEAQTSCKPCPNMTTTEGESSQSIDECLAFCRPGEYSSTGLEPCAKCEVGFYQPLNQQRFCTECPPGHTTLTNGSSSISQCIELCAPGYWSNDGFQPCQPCNVRYFQPKYGHRGCLPCPGTKTTSTEGSTSEEDCNVDAVCATDDCFNDAICESFIDGPRCTCAAGFTGNKCEINVMDCQDTSCANGGTCIDLVNDFACICTDGYEGDDCSIDIDECASNPCVYALLCVDLVADFSCTCMEGYTNKTCDVEIRPCESEPCQNGGTCQSQLTQFNCTCSPGYSGDNCEVDIDECQSNPCLNGGTCHDLPDDFQCNCINGFSGVTCEEDIDLCNPDPCLNGGLCVDEGGIYICVCPTDKTGFHCERDASPCDRNPCINGTCQEVDESDSETGFNYHCQCNEGFSGINCDVTVNKCESFPCSNNGTCENTNGSFVCHCPSSFVGNYCENFYNPCEEHPCENNGICIQEEGSFFCLCATEFTGLRCEERLSLCNDDFCQNGGYCAAANSSDVCVCKSGFSGVACEKQIDLCESLPCLNNGDCISGNSTFSCRCQQGYTGEICEVNIDECWAEPCVHGECEDRVNDYTCHCFLGFEGTDCEIDINDCSNHSCVHGECMDGNQTYICSCESGYRGRYCQEEFDECTSDPCFHSTGCIDEVDDYQCICEQGWTGNRCEINIDDCSPTTCSNGGTCVDHLNYASCLCLPGFSGERCNININECESTPCENGGTCHDLDDGYTCSCQRGWDGTNCQVRISMCQPNPCLHGGVCNTTDYEENENGYTCQCQPGLEGEHCEDDIDDCVNHDCFGAATCIDLLNGYRCICPPGFIGDTCSDEENPCETVPCLNNGTCNLTPGEDTNTPCLCPIGYEGQYCERNVDDCIPHPCLHDGKCVDGLNEFTCQCQPGFSGERCEENIDDCQYNNCDEIGTLQCQDEVNEFVCICRHGFLGRNCSERISSDFDIVFLENGKNPYLRLHMPTRKAQNMTLSLWVRTEKLGGHILSLEMKKGDGFYIYTDKVLKVKILRRTTIDPSVNVQSTIDTPVTTADNRWHHIATTFNHGISTVVVYVDGVEVTSQPLPLKRLFLPSNWIITLGGKFVPGNKHLRQFVGRISGVNIWDKVKSPTEISALSESRFVEIPGNILFLADFNAGYVGDVTFEQPSTCEAFDDCVSTPCTNGATCVDLYQGFQCICPFGLEGQTCSENPNDCSENSCLNGGTCIDGYGSFTCVCPQDYTGSSCELAIVHGGWSHWSVWTPCSQTCDGGNQTAFRQCNNPRPQNGGRDCDQTQRIRTQNCSTHRCPRCREFVPPRNGFARLVSNTSCTNCDLKYQVFCKEGYDFCRWPLYEYVCGPTTGYVWNHEFTNPRLRVPRCVKKSNVIGVEIIISGEYSGDICKAKDAKTQRDVVQKINKVTASNGQRQACVREGKCKMSIKAKPCSSPSPKGRRSQRDVDQGSAKVTMKITHIVSDSAQDYLANFASENEVTNVSVTIEEEINSTLSDMSTAFENMIEGTHRGLFRISSDGDLYDMKFVNGYRQFVCQEGAILKFNTTTCLTCEPGTYQKEDVCVRCDIGTYQPEEGKTRCERCPNVDSVVRTGLGAVLREECFASSSQTLL